MLTTSIILDVIIVAVLLIFLIRGLSKGLIMMLSGLAALVAGIFGGSYIAKMFSEPVANTLILPWVSKTLNVAAQGQQLPEGAVVTAEGQLSANAAGSLSGIMEMSDLPGFSFMGTIENIGRRISETGADLLNTASEVIAERIAYVILFIIAFILIQIIVHIIFSFFNLVSKAPILNTLNKWTGGVMGLATGILLVLLMMWVGSTFVKPAVEPGGILSEEVIENSYVARYFETAKNAILH